ncbi:hypothetical protein BH10CYA1_BH10CYA1_46100 [soil metagenome]
MVMNKPLRMGKFKPRADYLGQLSISLKSDIWGTKCGATSGRLQVILLPSRIRNL